MSHFYKKYCFTSFTNVQKKGNKIKLLTILFEIILFFGVTFYLYKNYTNKEINKKEKETINYQAIREDYNSFITTNKDTMLYDKDIKELGSVSKGTYLVLEDISDNYESEYFKLKYSDMYIKYTDIDKTEEKQQDNRYRNYIPFNKSIVLEKSTKLYIDDNSYYTINKEIELPIIIDDTNKYYVEFDNKLLYVNKEECKVIDKTNTSSELASSIPILNYHFVINKEAGEDKLCEPASICHTDTQFEEHIKYIKENNFYAITMKELEMFLDGKINLPKKSVSITIDDGWFVSRSKKILNDYEVMGTLFLIGSLAPVSDYASPYLEVHSHTWDLHNVSNCEEGRSALLCYNKTKLVEDLKKSRESLNNTTYFCYPFYEYNNNAIEALKEAGFTMALTGGNKRATRGIDKYKVPRYVIYDTTSVERLASILN